LTCSVTWKSATSIWFRLIRITAYLGDKFDSYRTTAVYGVVDDGENKRKLLVKGKNNLAARTNKTLAYRFGAREVGRDQETGETITAPLSGNLTTSISLRAKQ
jgi:hypothetical protein